MPGGASGDGTSGKAHAMCQFIDVVLQAYQCLAALEGTATLAQNTLDGIEALDQQELRKLSLYFDRVRPCCSTMHRLPAEAVVPLVLLRGILRLTSSCVS